MIANGSLGRSPAGDRQRGAIGSALTVFIAPPAAAATLIDDETTRGSSRRSRGTSVRGRILAALTLLMFAAPAGAVITDVEPANDSVATAPVQLAKTGTVSIDAGELVLIAGDIDFVGIAALSTGDTVTVTTTPLDDANLEVPDTIVGLFDSSVTDPTHMILCRGDDTENNELITGPQQDPIGRGSLCRFGITAPGTYYVGVTGFRSKFPPGCDPAAGECSSFPFDGGIGPTPCEEAGPTFTCGNYQVTIAVNTVPEPGVILQFVSGSIGLAWLNRRRNRKVTPSEQGANRFNAGNCVEKSTQFESSEGWGRVFPSPTA